ncbi:MAG: fumarylacetoacetate hydrolase family protein [Sediminibacterium sp.]|nr:fumarylacetoacetate hydrolase family protein [Sediminibacterium sp.]
MIIYAIGRNYVAHIQELGNEVPTEPVVFIKRSNSIQNQREPFVFPSFTNDIHFEGEIVLRISKGLNLNEKVANYTEVCNQITVGLDLTARDLQNTLKDKGLPWEKCKSFNGATVLGEFFPLHSLPSNQEINFSLLKNNQKVQQASSNLMIYNFTSIINHLTPYFSLEPNDIIFTGTPAGVAKIEIGDHFKGYLEHQLVLDWKV